jgi:RimJ/RimL family protein N-acetyltransferase
MSVARVGFDDQLAPTLLKRGTVALGPLLPQDSALMYLWLNDIETTGMDIPYRPTDGASLSTWLNTFSADPSRVLFAIRLAGRADTAGFLLLSGINSTNRSTELGIRIGREVDRSRGTGTAAVALGLSYAWDHLNLMRVQLRVMASNLRAISAYLSAGFLIEGQHRNAAFIAGRWHDMLTMAALNPRESPPG